MIQDIKGRDTDGPFQKEELMEKYYVSKPNICIRISDCLMVMMMICLPYLNPPVASGAVVNSHGAIGQGITKSAAMHMAQ